MDPEVTSSTVEDSSITSMEAKIIRQVEYYFGDVNLPRDKFLKEKMKEDNGWVSIECLTTFNRLKALSTDLKEISTALKKSTSGLLEVNDEDLKVRRTSPAPEKDDPIARIASKKKTLYMKGFPTDYTLDKFEDLFSGLGYKTVYVHLRRRPNHDFKGSIFVELNALEDAEKLLASKGSLKVGDSEIKILLRDEYYQMKAEERRGTKGSDKKSQKQSERAASNDALLQKKGCLLHFKGVSAEGISVEDVKRSFGAQYEIAWVDYGKNATEGYIRYDLPGAAQKAVDAIKEASDGKVCVKDSEVEVRILEGEEEENYLKMVIEDKAKRKGSSNRGGRGRGFGRGGGRGRGRGKRSRAWEDDRGDSKKQKESEHADSDD